MARVNRIAVGNAACSGVHGGKLAGPCVKTSGPRVAQAMIGDSSIPVLLNSAKRAFIGFKPQFAPEGPMLSFKGGAEINTQPCPCGLRVDCGATSRALGPLGATDYTTRHRRLAGKGRSAYLYRRTRGLRSTTASPPSARSTSVMGSGMTRIVAPGS